MWSPYDPVGLPDGPVGSPDSPVLSLGLQDGSVWVPSVPRCHLMVQCRVTRWPNRFTRWCSRVATWSNSITIRRHLRRCHNMSPPNTHFWKWSNGVERVEMDLLWCISMTNNVKSCKKIKRRAQTANFSVFTKGRRWPKELPAENGCLLGKLVFSNF